MTLPPLTKKGRGLAAGFKKLDSALTKHLTSWIERPLKVVNGIDSQTG